MSKNERMPRNWCLLNKFYNGRLFNFKKVIYEKTSDFNVCLYLCSAIKVSKNSSTLNLLLRGFVITQPAALKSCGFSQISYDVANTGHGFPACTTKIILLHENVKRTCTAIHKRWPKSGKKEKIQAAEQFCLCVFSFLLPALKLNKIQKLSLQIKSNPSEKRHENQLHF